MILKLGKRTIDTEFFELSEEFKNYDPANKHPMTVIETSMVEIPQSMREEFVCNECKTIEEVGENGLHTKIDCSVHKILNKKYPELNRMYK